MPFLGFAQSSFNLTFATAQLFSRPVTQNVMLVENMFKDLIISFCLKRIILKSKRNRIPLSGPSSLLNDDYEIRIEQLKGNPDISYLVKDLRNDSIVLGEWDGDKEIISEVKLSDIKLNNFVIEHFFKNWRIKYSGIIKAAFHEIFKLNYFKRIFQKVYDKNLDNFNDRFELLRILVAYREPYPKDYVPTHDNFNSIRN